MNIELKVIDFATNAYKAWAYRRFILAGLLQKLKPNVVLSFIYHTPCNYPQITYHINAIPFLPTKNRIEAVGRIRSLVQRHAACRSLKNSEANFFESNYILKLAESISSGPIRNPEVCYIGADSSTNVSRVDDSQKANFASSPIVSITSGAKHKRNNLTVEIFKKLLLRQPDAQLAFVGNIDAIRASLAKPNQEFVDASPNIFYQGYLDRAKLSELLSSAYCLLNTSELESFYMVAVEAMGAGCPVVLSNESSAMESVGDAGLLFSSNNIDEAVAQLLKLNEREFRDTIIQSGKQHFDKFNARNCAQSFVDRTCLTFNIL